MSIEAPMVEHDEKPIPWLELVETLFRRKRIVIFCVLFGLFGGAFIAVRMPPVYRAVATAILTDDAVSGPREKGMMSSQRIETEIQLLKSPYLIREVLQSLHESVVQPRDGLRARIQDSIRSIANHIRPERPSVTPDPLDYRVQAIARALQVRSIGKSNLIQVAYTTVDPQWAARLVNNLLAQHVERIARDSGYSHEHAFWDRQRADVLERLRRAQQALDDFQSTTVGGDLGHDEEQLHEALDRLQFDRLETETRIQEFTSRVEYLQEKLRHQPDTLSAQTTVSGTSPTVTSRERYLELALERTRLLSRYAPAHPQVKELDRQIAELEQSLEGSDSDEPGIVEMTERFSPENQALTSELDRSEAELLGAKTRFASTSGQIAGYEKRLTEVRGNAAELARLRSVLTAAEEAHRAYIREVEQARLQEALAESRMVNFRVLERAHPPSSPERSTSRRAVLFGLFAGIVFGTGIAFLRDYLDPSVKSAAQAARVAKKPVLAELHVE